MPFKLFISASYHLKIYCFWTALLFNFLYVRRYVLDTLRNMTWQYLLKIASTCVLLNKNDSSCFPVCCLQGWRLGIRRAYPYLYWPMSTPNPKKTRTNKIFDKGEDSQFIKEGIHQKTRSAFVCMTCQHVNYPSKKNIVEHLFHVTFIVVFFIIEILRFLVVISGSSDEGKTGCSPEVFWHLWLTNVYKIPNTILNQFISILSLIEGHCLWIHI